MSKNPKVLARKKRGPGGARPGAGRPKGTSDKLAKTKREVIQKILDDKKILPIEVMVEAMRHQYSQAQQSKCKVTKGIFLKEAAVLAEKAAPYLHHKLASMTLKEDPDHPLTLPPVEIIIVDSAKTKTGDRKSISSTPFTRKV